MEGKRDNPEHGMEPLGLTGKKKKPTKNKGSHALLQGRGAEMVPLRLAANSSLSDYDLSLFIMYTLKMLVCLLTISSGVYF